MKISILSILLISLLSSSFAFGQDPDTDNPSGGKPALTAGQIAQMEQEELHFKELCERHAKSAK